MKRKILILIILCILVIMNTSITQGRPLEESAYGSVGGVDVTATKGGNAGGSYWTSYVWSQADSAIGTIGHTWWTIRQFCVESGNYPYNLQLPGDVNYSDDSYFDINYNNYANCPYTQTYQLQNLGQHDFKQGGDTWRPSVSRIITISP